MADAALSLVRHSGVDIGGVALVDAPTGLALIHVDARGANAITIVPGANALVHAALLRDSDFGRRTTLVLQLEVPLAEVTRAAQLADRRGALVVLNAAPAMSLPIDLLDAVDVLVVNEDEAATVARAASLPVDPMDFCVAAADRHALAAIVTLGASGVVAADAGHRYRLPAAKVDVVDTTAAGDAFVGALAAALDRGDDLADALADGVAAGSYACTIAGAQASIAPRSRWQAIARELRAPAAVESRR
jgi:ribokinase